MSEIVHKKCTIVPYALLVIFLVSASVCSNEPSWYYLDDALWDLDYRFQIENRGGRTTSVEFRIPFLPDDQPCQKILSCVCPSTPVTTSGDSFNNRIAVIKTKIRAGENMLLNFHYRVQTHHTRWNVSPESAGSKDRAESGLHGGDPGGVFAKASREITGGERNNYYRCMNLYDHICSHYQFDSHAARCGAPGALRNRTIQCADAALLFVELARAGGLESRFAGGLLINKGKSCYNEYHAWSEVKAGSQWAVVDPAMGRFNGTQRLRCFMERQSSYITFWKGNRTPYEIIYDREQGAPLGVTVAIQVTPLSQTAERHVPETALFRNTSERRITGKPWKAGISPPARRHYYAGLQSERERNHGKARQHYMAALESSPHYTEAAEALLRLYRDGFLRERIYSDLKEMNRLDKKNGLLWYAEGVIERMRSHYSASSCALERAERHGFSSESLYFQRMCLYAETKEPVPFDKALCSCLAVNERNVEVYRKALLFYMDLELWDRCLLLSSRGRAEIPSCALFPAVEGFISMHRGRYERAETLLDEAISKDPAMGWYYCIRGWILLKKGERDKAAENIEKGLKLKSGIGNPEFFRSLIEDPSR